MVVPYDGSRCTLGDTYMNRNTTSIPTSSARKLARKSPVLLAARATVEALEDRRLLAADLPHISIAVLDGQASEVGADTGAFRVSRSGPTDQALTVRVFPAGNSHYNGSEIDYTLSIRTATGTAPFPMGALSFPVGVTSVDVVVTPEVDFRTEGDERVDLTIYEPLPGGDAYTFNLPWPRPSVTIADAAGAQSITLETSDPVGSENGNDPIIVTAKRTGDLSQRTQVWVDVTGTADYLDYQSLNTFIFEPGVTETMIFVAPKSDDLIEANETLLLTVRPIGLTQVTSPQPLTLTITDGPVIAPVILSPTADAWVGSGSEANQNFGSDEWMQIRDESYGGRRDIYLRFDLSSVDLISQADLQIYGKWLGGTGDEYGHFSVSGIADAVWTESGVTYNTAPTGLTYGRSGAGIGSANPGPRLVNFSVEGFLQKMKRLGHNDVTLMLSVELDPEAAGGPANAAFASRESSTPPRLVIQTDRSDTTVMGVSHRSLTVPEGGSGVIYTFAWDGHPDFPLNIMKVPGGDPDVNVVNPVVTYAKEGDGYIPRATVFTATPDSDGVNGSALFLVSNMYGYGAFVRVYESDTGVNIPPTDPNIITIPVTADGFAQNGAGNIGGVASTLKVKASSSGAQETYVQVDLSSLPDADEIGSAKLRLYGAAGALTTSGTVSTQAAAAPVSVSAFATAETDWFWNEFQLNWSTRPTTTGSAVVTKSVGTQGWYEFDIASILKAKKAAGAKTIAIALRGATTGSTSAVFSSDESGANRPQLVVTKGTSVVPPPAGEVVLQAETGTRTAGAAVGTTHAGYTGTGYVNLGSSGNHTQFAVSNAAGSHTVTLRYANGGTTNRPLSISVNGTVVVANAPMAPTGSWKTWKDVVFTVNLTAGTNVLRLTSTGSAGANVDRIVVSPVAVTPPVNLPVTYQAETAPATRSAGALIGTTHAGYSGTGYVNLGTAGNYAQVTATASTAGQHQLTVRYANGGSTNRPLSISVNGTVVASNVGAPTGKWTTWNELTFAVDLTSGANTIRLTSTGVAGANVDRVVVTPSGTTTTPPPTSTPAVTYQAELAARSSGAAIGTGNRGYTGSGYVNLGISGNYAQFTVNRATAGTTTVKIRYANGSTTDRPASISVNGVTNGSSLAFSGTGSWTTWKELTVTLNLTAGNNLIRLTSIGTSGANIDSLIVG